MRVDRGWLASIQLKAMGLVFALTGALVVFLATYFPARHIESVRAAMHEKAATYARLVAKQVESGVAFDDRETVREVFAATAEDADVRALALFTSDGRALFALGDFTGAVAPALDATEIEVVSGATFERATAPVIAPEGPRGTLVLEITTERVEVERRAIHRTAALVGLGSLVIGFLAAWVIARSLGRRLRAIAIATRAVAAGDLTVRPLDDASADEVGQLARAFNAMFANIRDLVQRIRETGARETERLDGLVRARTSELDARNRDLHLVLDNVSQGLVVVDRSGCPARERSAVVDRWLGEPAPGVPFWEILGRLDPRAGLAFQVNWEQLLEGSLPAELAIDQLPRRMCAGPRVFELQYTPLEESGVVERVLVVISDVTAREAAERAEGEQREILRAFERVIRDKTGFLEFLDDAHSLVDRLCDPVRPALQDVHRWLHTLKGNASLHGLSRLAAFCHELEDAVAESGADLDERARGALRSHWDRFAGNLVALLGDRGKRSLSVDSDDYDALAQAIEEGRPRQEMARMLADWKLELASERFARHAAQARALVQRAGGGALHVAIDAGRLRLSHEIMGPFWAAFAHAVRNTVAHGLEPPAERAAAGKAENGALRLGAHRVEDRVVIEIADDGRGVDWEAVRGKAHAMGLASETDDDLQVALFHDGLSTRDAADGAAGRGLGMGILRVECERLGGVVSVASAPGIGTTVTFSFPVETIAPGGGAPQANRSRSVSWIRRDLIAAGGRR